MLTAPSSTSQKPGRIRSAQRLASLRLASLSEAWNRFLDWGAQRPAALVLVFAIVQIVIWTAQPALVLTAPPLDVAESFLWGREGVFMTYKHPNLPGLLLEASYQLTGSYGWPAYLVAQLFVAATYFFVYRLGREFMSATAAAAGTILLAGCFYFSEPSIQFNHNIAQMPFWAAIASILWRAVERNGRVLWITLGLVSALGMYAKFSTAILLACGGLWLLFDEKGRSRLKELGPWLALAVFLAGVCPLAIKVVQFRFMPFYVALNHSEVNGPNFFGFIAAQLADISVMAAMAVFAVWAQSPANWATAPRENTPLLRRANAYLLLLTLGPIAFMALVALASGARVMWGTPMLNLVGLLVVLHFPKLSDVPALKRIAASGLAITVVVPLVCAAILLVIPYLGVAAPRYLLPQSAMSQRMNEIWRRQTNSPLRIVGGEMLIANMVALTAPDRPSIYIYPDPLIASWITTERIVREGALLVWEEKGVGPPGQWQALIGDNHIGQESFRWSPSDRSPPFKISFAIIPPTAQ